MPSEEGARQRFSDAAAQRVFGQGTIKVRPGRSDASSGLAQRTALLASFALASRLLGLVRDMSMAWLLGGGMLADALAAALRLPHVLRRLLGEGALSMTLTASLVHLARQAQGQAPADMRGLARLLALWLGLGCCGIMLVSLVASPWLADLLTPGFDPAQREITAELLRLCLPYVPCAVLAALGMALLHSVGVFWLPAFSPLLFNCVVLGFAAAGALGCLQPTAALALGVACGGAAQCLVQWLAVRRLLPSGHDVPATARARSCARDARACLRRLPQGLLGVAAPQVAMLLAMSLASGLGQGQVAALHYAERLLELPLGLTGVCLGMASLPTLSRLAAQGDRAQFAQRLSAALRLTLLFILPAVAGLWAVGPRLVEGLLGHGAFDARATQATWLVLLALLPALPALALNKSLLAACNALRMADRTAWSTVLAVATTLVTGVVLGRWLRAAIPLAVGVGMWTQTAVLICLLDQALRAPETAAHEARAWLPHPQHVLRQAVSALVTGLAARALLEHMAAYGLWPSLACAVGGGGLAWFACLVLLRDGDVLALKEFLLRSVLNGKRS
ncbi:MAG: murein biosynthesis integral membrane protein MurJ [Desulfovibrio sp.]|nr:murein biosynthesis integral membrane protein MurJ [Desulfovibrio sp.]